MTNFDERAMVGVEPKQVHAWYLAVYVDAVEWVELPNTLGMSQYADGGLMGSKPYVATGKYIDRISPHGRGCRYNPAQRSGESACPFTTLYWDFLMRHDLRSVRLQLELLKPELVLRQQRIRSTIVVFGGTRIVEETLARRRLEALDAEIDQQGLTPELARLVVIARLRDDAMRHRQPAREVGRRTLLVGFGLQRFQPAAEKCRSSISIVQMSAGQLSRILSRVVLCIFSHPLF